MSFLSLHQYCLKMFNHDTSIIKSEESSNYLYLNDLIFKII
jgi:hypothetical protein